MLQVQQKKKNLVQESYGFIQVQKNSFPLLLMCFLIHLHLQMPLFPTYPTLFPSLTHLHLVTKSRFALP